MSIAVRRIRPGEELILKDVRLAALADRPDAFGSTHAREAAFADDVWASRALESSAGDRAATFLAWRNDTPVGIVAGFRHDEVVELVSMWTSPTARRSGVGRRLVEAIIDWAGVTGAGRSELWVTRGNDSAQRLYESLGFVVTDEHQPLPSDPCKEEVRMQRPIADRRARPS